MSEWTTKELKDCGIEVIDGDRGANYPSREEFKPEGYCIFLSTSNIVDDKLQLDHCDFVSQQRDGLLRKGKLTRNDIILTTRGTVGSVAFYHSGIGFDNVRINSGMVILRSDKTFDPTFLYHLFKSSLLKQQYELFASGSAQPQLPIKDLKRVKLIFPLLSIQRKIAAVLSAYDNLIENNTRRIALLERMAEEVYREWFVRLRFPGHERVPVHQGVPEGWEINRLDAIVELAYGKSLTDENRIQGNYPVIGSSGIVGTHMEYLVEGPGIVIGRKGNVGSVHWIDANFYPIDTVYYVKSGLSLHYLYFLMHSLNFLNNDAAVPGLNRSQAYANMLLLPPNAVVDNFVDFASDIFCQKHKLMVSNENLKTCRDMLLSRLLSGKLDAENLDIRFPSGVNEPTDARNLAAVGRNYE